MLIELRPVLSPVQPARRGSAREEQGGVSKPPGKGGGLSLAPVGMPPA